MNSAWTPALATGVNQVDTEHIEIFRQAALLRQAMTEGKGRDELKKIVDFVDDYIVTHFSHEEKVMDQYHCPVAEINKQAHTKFIAKFKALKAKFDASGTSTTLVLEIASTINDWLIQHIKQIDSQLAACTKPASKQPATAAR
jgi:hemerythrin